LLLTKVTLAQSTDKCSRSIDDSISENVRAHEITVKVYDEDFNYLDSITCRKRLNEPYAPIIDCDLTGFDPNSHFFSYEICSEDSVNCRECIYSGDGESIGVLSVNIVDFNVEKSNIGNIITWTTQREKNIDFFLLRRLDNDKWVEVAREKAFNNDKTNSYSVVDASYNINSLNYYQLSEVDFNGQVKPIQTITVDNRSNKNLNIVGVYDLFGNVVDENYKGMVIVKYEDGSSIKTFQ